MMSRFRYTLPPHQSYDLRYTKGNVGHAYVLILALLTPLSHNKGEEEQCRPAEGVTRRKHGGYFNKKPLLSQQRTRINEDQAIQQCCCSNVG